MISLLYDIKNQLGKLDKPLLLIALLCSGYGCALVFSASRTLSNPNKYITVQIAAVVIGLILMFAISFIDFEHLRKYSAYIYAASLAALVLTLVLGSAVGGNKSWIPVFGITVQPSEIIKIFYVVTLAWHLDSERFRKRPNHIKNIALICLHAGVIIALVLLQGDLGTALVYIFMFLVMCFSAGISIWYFVAAIGATILASPIIYSVLSPTQQARILVGFNPEMDPLDKGYQALKSRSMISSGGLFGQGFLHGAVSQTNALPIKQSDFIFAVAGEELGLVGLIAIMLLLGLLFARLIYIGYTSRVLMGRYMCMGVAAMIMAQTLENIGMCMGMLPVIGITLPLFSNGGSSVVAIFMGIGLAMNVRARNDIYFFQHDEERMLKDMKKEKGRPVAPAPPR